MGRRTRRREFKSKNQEKTRFMLLIPIKIVNIQECDVIDKTLLLQTISLIISYEKILYQYSNDALLPHNKYVVMRKLKVTYDRLKCFVSQNYKLKNITSSITNKSIYNIEDALAQIKNIRKIIYDIQYVYLR